MKHTLTLLTALLLPPLTVLHAAEAPASKPNIIFILADDVGIGNVGCYGSDNFKTPNLDALAKSGLRFSQCYAMPQCSPSRCLLMTGRYPFRTGLTFNNSHPPLDPKRDVMIPTLMKQAGYITASVGKWHITLGPSEWGFDKHFVFPGSGHYWRDKAPLTKWYKVNNEKRNLTDSQYLPDLMHDFLVDFLTKNKEQPFFLYYPMSHIHQPIVRTPDSKPDADDYHLYADNIEYMDKLVGKLTTELERLNLREKTLIFLSSDNGTAGAYAKKSTIKGREIHGHKLSLSEGGSRVPLIVSGGCLKPGGQVLNDLVDFSDFFTTFADLGGAKLPEGLKLDGRSFAPQLRGEKSSPREWIFAQAHDNFYVREQGFKLTKNYQLFDMKDAPFVENLMKNDSTDASAIAARKRLQAVLDQLNPTKANKKESP